MPTSSPFRQKRHEQLLDRAVVFGKFWRLHVGHISSSSRRPGPLTGRSGTRRRQRRKRGCADLVRYGLDRCQAFPSAEVAAAPEFLPPATTRRLHPIVLAPVCRLALPHITDMSNVVCLRRVVTGTSSLSSSRRRLGSPPLRDSQELSRPHHPIESPPGQWHHLSGPAHAWHCGESCHRRR